MYLRKERWLESTELGTVGHGAQLEDHVPAIIRFEEAALHAGSAVLRPRQNQHTLTSCRPSLSTRQRDDFSPVEPVVRSNRLDSACSSSSSPPSRSLARVSMTPRIETVTPRSRPRVMCQTANEGMGHEPAYPGRTCASWTRQSCASHQARPDGFDLCEWAMARALDFGRRIIGKVGRYRQIAEISRHPIEKGRCILIGERRLCDSRHPDDILAPLQ